MRREGEGAGELELEKLAQDAAQESHQPSMSLPLPLPQSLPPAESLQRVVCSAACRWLRVVASASASASEPQPQPLAVRVVVVVAVAVCRLFDFCCCVSVFGSRAAKSTTVRNVNKTF